MASKKAPRCEGKRRQFRGNGYGVFKCMRKATAVVTTNVGFSERHFCCDSDECFGAITGGYPSQVTPIKGDSR